MGSSSIYPAHHTTFAHLYSLRSFYLVLPVLLIFMAPIRAQEVTGLEIVRTLEHTNFSISAIDCYFKDGHQLIAYSNNSNYNFGDTLVVYNFLQDQVLAEIPGVIWSYEIRFIHADQLLYKNNDKLYRFIHFNAPEITELLPGVFTFTVSDDKSTITMLEYFNNAFQVVVANYDTLSGGLIPVDTFSLPEPPDTEGGRLVFSQDKKYLALNGGYERDYVYIINLVAGTINRVNTPVNHGTYSPAFYTQGGKLRLAVGGSYDDGSIEIVDVGSLAAEASIPVFSSYMYALAVDPTQEYVACGGSNTFIKLFNVQDTVFTPIDSAHVGHTDRIIFTQDSQYLISGHGLSSIARLHIYRILRESSGISTAGNESFSFYPNPATSLLQLEGIGDAVISIYDLQGKMVMQRQTDGTSFDVSALPPGLYLVKMESDKKVRSKMFVKE